MMTSTTARRFAAYIAAMAATAGCATSLHVHEVPVGSSEKEIPTRVDGLLVNKRARYQINIVSVPGFAPGPVQKLDGVDQDKMLSIDMCRYPFASGKLTLSLNDHQQTKTLELSGEPGLANAITATTEALATKAALEPDEKKKKKNKEQ